MRTEIITRSRFRKTADKLGESLGVPVREEVAQGRVIRWGTTSSCSPQIVYNKARRISRSSDKLRAGEIMSENGLPIPELNPSGFPVIGRKRRHFKGRGMWYCRNRFEVKEAKREGAEYFVRYIPKEEEFRVHIGSGMVLYVQRKIGDKKEIVWNHDNGFKYDVLRRREWRESIVSPSIEAVRCLGLDFGAVDVMEYKGQPYILEVNTAPSLEGYSVEKYTDYFQALMEIDEYVPFVEKINSLRPSGYRFKKSNL